jgi:predicted PurR-regulated permease PerM
VGIKFLAIAIIIDLVTDNVLAPRLMGELIGLNPVWIFIALFIGAKIGGVLGLLLAIPIASVTKQIIDDLREEKSKKIEPKIPIDD